MPHLPEVKPKELASVLYKLGFESRPGKGSHTIFIKGQIHLAVPMHPKPIGRGLLVKILKQAGVTKEEFLNNL